jgi:membrane associated rhomboid family serine protease
LTTESSDIVLRIAGSPELAEEWALVLVAQALSPSVRRTPEGFALSVPPDEAERAARVLSAYESENRRQEPPRDEEPAASGSPAVGLAVSAALLAFFLVTGPRAPGLPWFERGGADAERILHGEPWRAVTALTLHADLGHALANALAGALFLGAVCAALGPGLGCALVLLAGAGGNLINALVQGSPRVSVGASTAVFGAVGVLSGLGVARRRSRRRRERPAWLPIAAGFAILAMLGTAGARVDPWAHLFGLLAGAALGIPVGLAASRPPGRRVQWILGAAAIAALAGCWARALR